MLEPCPCGSGLGFKKCCKRLISGKARAVTPLELMRSRYSAYATGAITYIIATTVPEKRSALDPRELAAWSKESAWLGLEIVASGMEENDPQRGFVEFVAIYKTGGQTLRHHEYSRFCRIDYRWYYEEGSFFE